MNHKGTCLRDIQEQIFRVQLQLQHRQMNRDVYTHKYVHHNLGARVTSDSSCGCAFAFLSSKFCIVSSTASAPREANSSCNCEYRTSGAIGCCYKCSD